MLFFFLDKQLTSTNCLFKTVGPGKYNCPTPYGRKCLCRSKIIFLVKIFLLFLIFKHQEEELSQARDELNKLREDETKLEREVRNFDLIKWGEMLCLLFLSFLFLFFILVTLPEGAIFFPLLQIRL